MKLKVIKIPFVDKDKIDISSILDIKTHYITSVSNQIVVEGEVAYNYLSVFYKTTIYDPNIYKELQEAEKHKENLSQEIYNLIKEKYPTYKKLLYRRYDIADDYTNLNNLSDFKRIKNYGETTINKEKHILLEILEIIKKYRVITEK